MQGASGGCAEFHTPFGRGAGRVQSHIHAIDLLGDCPAPVADDIAAVAVHREGNHWVVEALPVIIQIEQSIHKSVAQTLLMEGLVGVGDVEAVFQ